MERESNLIISVILIVIISIFIFKDINYTNHPKESNTDIINAQKEILRIDTIVKRYDSIIYKTKIKTNEKIITIYLWPDSVLLDSIRARLQDFDSTGVPKNINYNGAI